jgi:hypothetical protein
MKESYVALLFLVSSLASAEPASVEFSAYTGDVTISKIYRDSADAAFSGTIETEGRLVFTLDMLTETTFAGIQSINLVPDHRHLSKFPQVVAGFYPGRLEKIYIQNLQDALAMTYNGTEEEFVSGAENRKIAVRGTFEIKNYGTSVDCDARQYWAELVSFVPAKKEVVFYVEHEFNGGC